MRHNTAAVERSTNRQILTGGYMQRNLEALAESTAAVQSNSRAVASAVGTSMLTMGAIVWNALVVAQSTKAMRTSREAINSNTQRLDTLQGEIKKANDETAKLNTTLSESAPLAAIATLLFGLLYFLSQWSWDRMRSHHASPPGKRGDPEMVLYCYLFASTFVCLIGVGVFAAQWMRQGSCAGFWSWVGCGANLCLLALAAVRCLFCLRLAFVPSWRSGILQHAGILATTRPYSCQTRTCRSFRWLIIGVLCSCIAVLLLHGALSAYEGKFMSTANLLLVILFSMFSAGVYDAVICDDRARI
ncbi:MAG: hypothetical protein AB7I19_10340 [Planctomycetota bacterium]